MANQLKRELKISKTNLSRDVGVSRRSLYYERKMDKKDILIKQQIQEVLSMYPSYGHRRIAIALSFNKKRILRIMHKYDIKPYRRRIKRLVKKDDIKKPSLTYPNLIKRVCPIVPFHIWAQDFTYIRYANKFIYIATVIDLYTREVVGTNISSNHDTDLVKGALKDALSKYQTTDILHSDQGSEYTSEEYINFLKKKGIQLSLSQKSSPWENGFQESFYNNFKLDLGHVSQFESVEELIEAIYLTIYKYNNNRIHSKLKMSPVQFKYSKELVCNKMGT